MEMRRSIGVLVCPFWNRSGRKVGAEGEEVGGAAEEAGGVGDGRGVEFALAGVEPAGEGRGVGGGAEEGEEGVDEAVVLAGEAGDVGCIEGVPAVEEDVEDARLPREVDGAARGAPTQEAEDLLRQTRTRGELELTTGEDDGVVYLGRDAEIAIGGIGAQARVEILLAMVADREALRLACLGACPDPFCSGFLRCPAYYLR